MRTEEGVDVVVTWVDGEAVEHQKKREMYAKHLPLSEVNVKHATHGRRFLDGGELRYCLRSIRRYAGWVNRIFVVTDDQVPSYIDAEAAEAESVLFVSHKTIYAGYEDLLPVFNSRSIETFLWRIPDLSECFVYFNDDMFLTSETTRDDFFREDGAPVLRGRLLTGRDQVDHAALHGQGKYARSADLVQFPGNRYFKSFHVAHPLRRSSFESLFMLMPERFVRNASYRFRSEEQFFPMALVENFMLMNKLADVLQDAGDAAALLSGAIRKASVDELKAWWRRVQHTDPDVVRLVCINNFPLLCEKVDLGSADLEAAFGVALPFER